MLTDDETPVTKQEDTNDTSPDNVTVRLDKVVEVVKKSDKKTDAEDPKPRIVLTFRSEKTGAKSSNMKIVSAEEKHEEISPRRSIRTRNTKKEFDDDNIGHVDSDDDEPIESIMTHKRPTRHRYKFSDVIAKAIARKENIYNAIAPRSYHKIKPTTKKPTNEDSRVEMESKNKARLGKSSDKSAEEHVRKRRCVQSRNYEAVAEKSSSKRKIHEESATESSDRESDTSNKKLMHMGTLGLKIAKDEESNETENRKTESSANEGGEEEEIDDDTEVISKLLQADEESASDEDFCPETSKRKRANRNCSPAPLRRSTRKPNLHSFFFRTYQSDTGDSASEAEDTEAKCPTNSSKTIVTCLCEESSNVHAAPSELTEPVFCQAVETVEGVRVGCSHGAARDADGALHPLRRAALRTPYFLACKLHSAQLTKHMCCPTCGLFCTEGIFYQCSKGHLFHLECGIVGDPKQKAGCPHCGVWYRWEPANVDYVRVRVQMHCSNKRVFLPDQREQCTPAFLGFSSLDPALLDQEPTFPKELLPVIQNVKELMECTNNTEGNHHYSVQNIYDAIMANESIEEIVSKIVRCENVNEAVSPECGGGSVAQAAAARGRLDVLVALRARAACFDAADSAARTPLITAMLALLDRDHPEETELEGELPVPIEAELPVPIEAELPVKKEEENEQNEEDKSAANTSKEKVESDVKDEVVARENTDRPGNDDLVKVIQYLIAVGCDVDKKGPEGLCALHMAAEHGGLEQTLALLAAGARVDARNDDGWTPLVMAAENKHAAIVRILLAAGADPEACDVAGNQPVHWSAQVDADRTLALLLHAAPHAINALNVHTETPLHTAARQGHYACVVLLLEHGAKTDIENKDGVLPIELSSGPCHDAISTHMQMTLVVRDTMQRTRIISSDISNGREPFPVSVVNEVDDATLDDFTYVSQHVRTEHIPIDDSIETMQGCTCADGDCGAECSCCVLSVRRWTRGGRLPPDFPHHDPPVLFECNHTCACNPKRCANRLVGRMEGAGSLAVRVQVFRTARRGWGLRAAARAGRGALLALYRGELLPGDRADARTDDQYMFALDLKPDLLEQCGDKTVLCVDASRYGSAARFMNHSCRPTAAPVRVFTDARDLRLPHVAFFALVDIAPGDELTFDYGDKFWSVKSKWMKCECEAPDCRYPTENTDEEES